MKLLLLSDIHYKCNQLERVLSSALASSRTTSLYDGILICGDILDVGYDENHYDVSLERQLEEVMEVVMIYAKQIVVPGGYVLYVGGNHDPACCFERKTLEFIDLTKSTASSGITIINSHNAIVQVQDNPRIVIIGYGGACEGYYSDVTVAWRPYPCSHNEHEAKLNDLLETITGGAKSGGAKKLGALALSRNDMAILMTHQGPKGSCTTEYDPNNVLPGEDQSSPRAVSAGCRAIGLLSDAVRRQCKQLICHVHGHNHHEFGCVACGGTRVINVSGVLRTRYGEINIDKATGIITYMSIMCK